MRLSSLRIFQVILIMRHTSFKIIPRLFPYLGRIIIGKIVRRKRANNFTAVEYYSKWFPRVFCIYFISNPEAVQSTKNQLPTLSNLVLFIVYNTQSNQDCQEVISSGMSDLVLKSRCEMIWRDISPTIELL